MMAGEDFPRLTVHYAQTLDGRIATRTGQSQWISCDATLALAHRLRAEHQAVMVGVGTICADNPRLTVRLVSGTSPLRAVVDSTLRLPLDAHVLTDGAAQTLVVATDRAKDDRIQAVRRTGAEVLLVARDESGRVDLADLFSRLAALGVRSILLEGGSALITSALQQRLVDRLVVCIAPKVIGSGIDAVGNLGIVRVSDAVQFAESSFTTLGADMIFDGQVAREEVVALQHR